MKRKRRRIGRWVTGAAVVAAAVLHPWILGLGVRGLLFGYGAAWAQVEVEGYRAIRVEGLSLSTGALHLEARTVEFLQPLGWLAERRRGWFGDPAIEVEDWTLELVAGAVGAPESGPSGGDGAIGIYQRLREVRARLAVYVPSFSARSGIVRRGAWEMLCPALSWNPDRLQLDAVLPLDGREVEIQARSRSLRELQIEVREAGQTWAEASARVELRGTVLALESRGTLLGAAFSGTLELADDWTVRSASMEVPEFVVTGAEHGIERLEAFQGYLRASYTPQAWSLESDVHGQVLISGQAREVRLLAEGGGDATGFTLRRFEMDTPFADGSLDAPVTFSLERGLQLPESGASLAVSLDDLRDYGLSGRARLSLQGGEPDRPHSFRFSFEAQNLEVAGRAIPSLLVDGLLDLPRLAFTRVEIDAGSFGRLEGRAEADLETGLHSGALTLSRFMIPWIQPLDMSMVWQGKDGALETSSFELLGEGGVVRASLRLQLVPGGLDLSLPDLSWENEDRGFALANSGVAMLRVRSANGASWPAVTVSGVNLQDATGTRRVAVDGSLDLAEGTQGGVVVAGMASEDVSGWLDREIPRLALGTGSFAFRSEERPGGWRMFGTLSMAGTVGGYVRAPLEFEGSLHLEEDGVRAENLRLEAGPRVVGWLAGSFPVAIEGRPSGLKVVVDPAAQVDLQMEVEGSAEMEAVLRDWAGVATTDPRLRLSLGGSWEAPQLAAEFAATTFTLLRGPRGRELSLEALAARLSFAKGVLVVESLDASLEGAKLGLSLRLPVDAGALRSGADLRAALAPEMVEGALNIDGLPVALLARYYPEWVARTGEVSAHLKVEPGLRFDGNIDFAGLQTRALPTGAFLHEMSGRFGLNGRRLEIESFAGKVNYRPVVMSGYIDIEDPQQPRFELNLQGENLTLARNQSALVRADLDLHLARVSARPAKVSGQVRLRDSLFVQQLIGGTTSGGTGGQSPAMRPPWFSIREQPLADWRLDVDVTGPSFMKIDAQVLTGVLSADFKLSGTLGEPRLTGRAELHRGRVNLAFGSLRVESGEAWITLEDPYTVNILASINGRAFGYDIFGRFSGTLDSPVPQLTASPPLDSDEILLMLTAGVIPQREAMNDSNRGQALAVYFGQGFLEQLIPGSQSGLSERLEISYGEDFSEKGRETYGAEYRLDDRFTLRGEYDEYDDYNVTLKWKVYSR